MAKIRGMEKSSAATLRDVAARAGVTSMTASRVTSGNGYASKATREAVMKAVEELGYRPNMSAQAMRQQRSHSVGVLVQNNARKRFTHPLAWEFILGINEGLEQSGYMTSLIRIDDIAEDGDFTAKAFEGHLLDGLIAVNAFPPHLEERIEALAPHCVWLDANVWHEHSCIQRDEAWAGELAVRELAKLGYREIVMVCAQLDGAHPHYSQTERFTRRARSGARVGRGFARVAQSPGGARRHLSRLDSPVAPRGSGFDGGRLRDAGDSAAPGARGRAARN